MSNECSPNDYPCLQRGCLKCEGVRITRANVAGYEKGFKAAQEYNIFSRRWPGGTLIDLIKKWNDEADDHFIGTNEEASILRKCAAELKTFTIPLSEQEMFLERHDGLCPCCQNKKVINSNKGEGVPCPYCVTGTALR